MPGFSLDDFLEDDDTRKQKPKKKIIKPNPSKKTTKTNEARTKTKETLAQNGSKAVSDSVKTEKLASNQKPNNKKLDPKKLRVIKPKKPQPKELPPTEPARIIKPSSEEITSILKELEELREHPMSMRFSRMDELYQEFSPLRLREIYEEAIRSIPGYQGRLTYLKEFVFPEKGVLNPSEISILLNISLGESIVLLRDYLHDTETETQENKK